MEIHIKSSAKAQDYFNQGKQFLEAAWRCLGKKSDAGFNLMEDGKFYQLMAPCVVNSAFSCEMFLKALLIKLKINYNRNSKGHNLYLLYKKLPLKIQDTIAKFCGNKNDATVFENWLENHAKDFMNIRYFVEYDGWTEMSPISVITVADNLSTIVDYLINNSKELEKLL